LAASACCPGSESADADVQVIDLDRVSSFQPRVEAVMLGARF
jgi:hypothetical protein